jgi:hypothetical protein
MGYPAVKSNPTRAKFFPLLLASDTSRKHTLHCGPDRGVKRVTLVKPLSVIWIEATLPAAATKAASALPPARRAGQPARKMR